MPRQSSTKINKPFGVYEKVKEGTFLVSSHETFMEAAREAARLCLQSSNECRHNSAVGSWSTSAWKKGKVASYRRGVDFIFACSKNSNYLKNMRKG